MKKIDKLILKSFLGPFILTFFVVVFILLLIHVSKYFDDIVGKNLGWGVISELFFYFAVFNTPIAIPLAILLSSLMTFGNLGEHSEIIALKGAGISLTRALEPIFFLVIIITGIAFYSNNYLVPHAALNAYSLIYDIKQKKPALDIKEGTFYNGLPNYSIKVSKKMEDGRTLKNLIIYNHSEGLGNKEVILADSGLMYTILHDRYLKFELYNGSSYREADNAAQREWKNQIAPFTRTFFKRSVLILDLSSFDLKRTTKELFSGDRLTRNFTQLGHDIDSLVDDNNKIEYEVFRTTKAYYAYHLTESHGVPVPARLNRYEKEMDSLEFAAQIKQMGEDAAQKTRVKETQISPTDTWSELPIEKVRQMVNDEDVNRFNDFVNEKVNYSKALNMAVNSARQIKTRLTSQNSRLDFGEFQYRKFLIQYHKMMAHAVACIVMFLIGAPLGAIIKRGGIGVPVLFSILFFILFYVIYITGENWAKENKIIVEAGIWMSDVILTPIGLFFLRQARRDARLFDADYYRVLFANFLRNLLKKAENKPQIITD